MSHYLCHEHPEVLSCETRIVASRPGAVLLKESYFYPGGGGQLTDRGTISTQAGSFDVASIEEAGGQFWHVLSQPVELHGDAFVSVDPAFRSLMCQLHTGLHVVNALVFQAFNGALVTGVQMNDDGTARIDFDLHEASNDQLRALEPAINDAIRQDLPVRAVYADAMRLREESGLLRSRSVAPPTQPDGSVRIIEIAGLDQQACGGTHLSSTGQSRPIRILKIDNKGRHNRRVRIGLV